MVSACNHANWDDSLINRRIFDLAAPNHQADRKITAGVTMRRSSDTQRLNRMLRSSHGYTSCDHNRMDTVLIWITGPEKIFSMATPWSMLEANGSDITGLMRSFIDPWIMGCQSLDMNRWSARMGKVTGGVDGENLPRKPWFQPPIIGFIGGSWWLSQYSWLLFPMIPYFCWLQYYAPLTTVNHSLD